MTNTPFKVLLCGGSGLLGQELLHSIPEGVDVWAPSSSELDIRDLHVMLQKAATYQPDLIINAAAYTNVDAAETNQELAFAINRDGPENLGLYAAQADIPVFHISTDYVFDGTKSTPYTEEDEPNPINVYGKSKLAGELALQRVCAKSLILRTSWLVGERGDCFVRRFISLMYEQERIYAVADQYSSPTRADRVAELIWYLVGSSKKSLPIKWGVSHCSGEEVSSKYQVVEGVFNVLRQKNKKIRCEEIVPVSHRFFLGSARRPTYSSLQTAFSGEGYRFFWDNDIERMIENIAKQIDTVVH